MSILSSFPSQYQGKIFHSPSLHEQLHLRSCGSTCRAGTRIRICVRACMPSCVHTHTHPHTNISISYSYTCCVHWGVAQPSKIVACVLHSVHARVCPHDLCSPHRLPEHTSPSTGCSAHVLTAEKGEPMRCSPIYYGWSVLMKIKQSNQFSTRPRGRASCVACRPSVHQKHNIKEGCMSQYVHSSSGACVAWTGNGDDGWVGRTDACANITSPAFFYGLNDVDITLGTTRHYIIVCVCEGGNNSSANVRNNDVCSVVRTDKGGGGGDRKRMDGETGRSRLRNGERIMLIECSVFEVGMCVKWAHEQRKQSTACGLCFNNVSHH